MLKTSLELPEVPKGTFNYTDDRDNGDIHMKVQQFSTRARIARANGHPEWEADIRSTFARRWVANAPAGWWYQQDGAWKQK